jgi:exonuclease III
MSLQLVTINVNGLRDNRTRELVFNWLVSKKYDCICLQETHCTRLILTGGRVNAKHKGAVLVHGYVDLVNRGVWLSFYQFACDINFDFSRKTGRLLKYEMNTDNAVFLIFNIYALNICSDRKQFVDSFQNISYNHEDDSIDHYNIVLWDFNCILDNKKRLTDTPIDVRTT